MDRYSMHKIKTIDMHTGGEPLRVIIDGLPEIPGNNVLERRRYVQEQLDHFRKALMWEPRGHADMYGCIIVPPNDEGAEFGIIFMHNAGYSTMCGHATIAIGRLALELGWVKEKSFNIDAPCGRLNVKVINDAQVSFIGVPSFVLSQNRCVRLDSGEEFNYDIAYGGAFYAYVTLPENQLPLIPENYGQIKSLGGRIKRKIMADQVQINHPESPDLSFLYGTIFIGGPVTQDSNSRNVCIFADEEVDRSPTGSGVMGRLALLHTKGKLDLNAPFVIESIIGSKFEGKILDTITYGGYQAIIPEVTGRAYIIGENTFYMDPEDPFRHGFFLH